MYKKWSKICEIGRTQPFFMNFLAHLDLQSEFGQDIVRRFPEYFSETEEQGPVPLSVIRELANLDAQEDGAQYPTDKLVSFDGHWAKFNIPLQSFSTDSDVNDHDPPLPDEIVELIQNPGFTLSVGDIIQYQNSLIVLLENNEDTCTMDFAPAECIAVDL